MLKTLYILFVSPILLFQQVNFNKERALIESSKNDSIIIDAYLKIIKGFTLFANFSIEASISEPLLGCSKQEKGLS